VFDAETSFPAHRILAGGLAPGERLPSEHDLAEQYGTGRPTVQRAIARLKAEGLCLQISPGVPVVRILRTVDDAGDRPVEVQDTVAAADRHAFRYEGPTADERTPACR
jgi:DNA-binding GntR family transcriptional regulator